MVCCFARRYSKSPNGLVFYGKPRVNVPTLKLSVLRSPRGDTDVRPPDPTLSRNVSSGDKTTFSPRSVGENSETSK
jgi:hypothetical protein